MRFSAEQLIQPISEEQPCGEDLEYDPVFQQMETMMQTTPEQEFGDTVIAGTGPDWKGVAEQVEDLLKRTRDLRVLTYGALAQLHLSGLGAFNAALAALNACLETFWGEIHPQLDEEDNNDATMRFNTLQMLNDHQLVVEGLLRAPLVELKGVGAFSVRDIELAEGKIQAAQDEEVVDIALIQGAFSEASPEAMTELGEGVGGAIEQLKGLSAMWDQLAPAEPSIDIDASLRSMNDVLHAIKTYAPVAAAMVSGEEAEEEGAEAGDAAPVSGAINNRNDVVRALDKICEYYSAKEPSSPIPLLLRRAQRLVPKTFVEILEDMVPTSLEMIEVISGTSGSNEE